MKHVIAEEHPPFTLEHPRYNQVSCCIAEAHLELSVRGSVYNPELTERQKYVWWNHLCL